MERDEIGEVTVSKFGLSLRRLSSRAFCHAKNYQSLESRHDRSCLAIGSLKATLASYSLHEEWETWLALAMATAIARGGKCGPWQAMSRIVFSISTVKCHAKSFVSASKVMSGNENLSILNHEALFHLKSKVLNLADPVTQEALTHKCSPSGVKVLFLDN